MPNVDDMVMFAELVKAGGFSRAASRLAMPKSTISRRVSRLESELGVRLVERNTHSMRLTEVGEALLCHCNRIVDEVGLATQVVERMEQGPTGVLCVTASHSIGRQLLAPVVEEFLRRFPRVRLRLVLTNRRVDLIEEGFDLAIRVGPLPESNLIARKVGGSELSFFSSPAYLKTLKKPVSIGDLHELCVLHMSSTEAKPVCRMIGPDGPENVPLNMRFVVNDFHLMKQLLVDGSGIGILPNYMCVEELKAGSLCQLLPEWSLPSVDFHAVYPSARGVTPKLRAFLDVLDAQVSNRGARQG